MQLHLPQTPSEIFGGKRKPLNEKNQAHGGLPGELAAKCASLGAGIRL